MERRILVVEDSPTQAAQLQYLLEEHRYDVTVAANGKQALATVETARPDLVISDIVMPEMNGYEFCTHLKSETELKDIPVMLVTDLPSPHDVLKGLQCGADAFIRKPYDERYLLSRITSILANSQLRKTETTQLGVEISISGQRYFITSERQQILGLLISTYEEAIRLNEELHARQRDLENSYQSLHGLFRIAEGLNQAKNEQEVAEKALERALELPGVKAGWIFFYDAQTGFRTVATCGLPPDLQSGVIFDGDCACRQQLLSGNLRQAVNIPRCERLERVRNRVEELLYHACAPLLIGNRPIGILNLVGTERGLFTDEELKILSGVANQVGVALERAHLHAHLEDMVRVRTEALHQEIAERKRTENSLRKSEEQIRLLLDSTAEAIYGLDMHGNCTFANPACLRLLGYQDVRDLLGKNMHKLIHHARPDGTPYPMESCRIYKAFQEGVGAHVDDEVFWRADGTSFLAEYWSYPIYQDNKIVGSVVTFLDITDRKRAEEELRSAHMQLIQSAKLESVGRMAAGVAHEVKNPLAVIQYGLGYLSQTDLTTQDDKVGPVLEKMENAVQRADRVIRGLLDFSASSTLEITAGDLNPVVEQSLLLMQYETVRGHITVVKALAEHLPLVKLDRHKIEQVFVNLFVNAIQAMPDGGTLTVTTSAQAFSALHADVKRRGTDRFPGDATVVVVEVDDTGTGIPAETLDRVFDPFFTTKPIGEGTGLGLSVTRKIIELHGGTIGIQNREEGGTRVTLVFPIGGSRDNGEETDPAH